MDFEKLKRYDPAEWWSIRELVYGVALQAACQYSGLSGGDLEDIAAYAYQIACEKIMQIQPTEKDFRCYVFKVAENKAKERQRQNLRKVTGHSVSFDEHEETGSLEIDKETAGLESPPDNPDAILRQAEKLSLFHRLLKMLPEDDLELLYSLVVEETPQKVLAEKLGVGTSSIGNRKNQACARLAKVLRSDPQAQQLLIDLDLDHLIE